MASGIPYTYDLSFAGLVHRYHREMNLKHDVRNLLAINTGSSSVRLTLLKVGAGGLRRLATRRLEGAIEAEPALLRDFSSASAVDIDLVVQRVVYGGNKLGDACILDHEAEQEIERLSPVAPLHNPLALRWIRACRKAFGDGLTQVAVFDTSFFFRLPEIASTYALPRGLCRKYGLRRHGFHGIAHRVMLRKWQSARPRLPAGGRVVTVQLGSGCSIAAISSGEVLDTSMGFSPLEGLVMATRPGDLDPGLVMYLQRHAGMSPAELDRLLNEQCGLRGISEESGDMRALLRSKSPGARLAVDIYCYRVRKYIGAYLAVLGGIDGIVFGGGVGENSPAVREGIVNAMAWLDTALDAGLNGEMVGREGFISAPGAGVEVMVASVDENAEMARVALDLLGIETTDENGGRDGNG